MNNPRALILAGDAFHDAGYIFEGVGTALGAEGIAAETTTDYAALDKEMLADRRLLVFHRDGMEFPNGKGTEPKIIWLRPHQEEAIESFVLEGGGFLALHNSGWAYPATGAYRRTLGGYYIGHPAFAEFRVEVVNHEHPVTRDVESYDIEDEQHWLHWDYDRVTPLLVSRGRDGRQSVSGWAYEHGKGRVVFLPHGHTLEALLHPQVQRLLRNAVRWLFRG